MQRVQQSGGADHRGAVLVVVENGDIHFLFEPLLDDKTLGSFDILEVNAAKGRPHQPNSVTECVGVFGIQLDINRIDVSEALEQHRLAFHHRLGRQRAKVAQAKHGCAVRDDSDQIALFV